MATGIFKLRDQLYGLVQKAWNPSSPVSTYVGSFNGSSQYLNLGGQSTFAFGSGSWTIEFWFYTTTTNVRQIIYDSKPSGGSGFYPTITISPSTANNVTFYTNGNDQITSGSTSPNYWYHVAVVKNGTTTTLYLNGISQGTYADTNTYLNGASRPVISTNGGSVGGNGLVGNISNLRVVNGSAVYTANFTPPIGPLTAITNTVLLTLQNATIVDNSTNAYTITNTGSVTTYSTYPFNVSSVATPTVEYLVVGGGGGAYVGGGGAGGLLQGITPIKVGSPITVTVGAGGGNGGTPTSGLNSVFGSVVAIGGGSSNVSGGSGGGGAHSGTLNGGQGTSGQGNAGGVNASGTTNAAGGGGAGSAGSNSTSTTAANSNGAGGSGISSAITGTVVAYAGGGGGSGSGATGPGGSGGGGTGNSSSTTANNGTANTGGGGGGAYAVGGYGNGGSGIVVISYPDTYNAPVSFGGSNNPTASTSGSGSLSFNGSTTYVVGPTTSVLNFGTGNFTVEFWAYATAIGTLTEFFSCSNATQDFQIALSPTNYLYWHNSGVQISNVGTPASCPLNQWNHIVFVRSGTNCALFCNGVRYGTTTNSAAVNLTNYYVGAYWNAVNAYNLNGYMSNIRVSNTALYSPTSSTLTVPTAPFTATSSTVLLMSTVSGAQFADSSASSLTNSVGVAPTWNQSSPFATGLGYKNRVYTWTASGTVTF